MESGARLSQSTGCSPHRGFQIKQRPFTGRRNSLCWETPLLALFIPFLMRERMNALEKSLNYLLGVGHELLNTSILASLENQNYFEQLYDCNFLDRCMLINTRVNNHDHV